MDWRQHIHSDPEILSGKLVVKGTRLSVDFLLELLAAGCRGSNSSTAIPTSRVTL